MNRFQLTTRTIKRTYRVLVGIMVLAWVVSLTPGAAYAQDSVYMPIVIGNGPAQTPIEQPANPWPELPLGSNGLVQRYVLPKPDKVTFDPTKTIAGLFVVKFVEGSHTRLTPEGLSFDPALINDEEQARLNRAGVKLENLKEALGQFSAILAKYNASHGFEIAYLFRTVNDPYIDDEQFVEKAELEQRAGEELADLDLYYVLYAKDFTDATVQEALMNEVNQLPIVELVSPAVVAEGAQATTPTIDVTAQQGYLDAAPTGLDARYAWTQAGGRGDRVRVVDVEWDWVTDHEDFPPAANLFWGGRPACAYDGNGTEHGTAVLGVIAAPDNGTGVTGFASNARYGLSSTCRPFDYVWAGIVATFSGESFAGRAHNVVVATAINAAAGALGPGDVLLVEQHTWGPPPTSPCPCNCGQWGFVPMEYYQESFDVIRRATGSGIIVVEAAGNGGQNLDDARYVPRFTSERNSQAILVGASGAGDRMPACFTNSSRRVDVHAWGEGVVTLGYGGGDTIPFNNTPIRRFYTAGFGGTSSASAIVAGAIVSLQGVRRSYAFLPYGPFDLRNLLVATGTRQDGDRPGAPPVARPIGRQPNLRSALAHTLSSSGGFSGPGVYTVRSVSSSKVLDVDIGWWRGQDNGQKLIQWDHHGGLNQQFRVEDAGGGYYRLRVLHSGKVLDVAGGSTASGADLQQYQDTGGDNQLFRIESYGGYSRIRAKHSGLVLDVRGNSNDNGTQIQQYVGNNNANQLFIFTRLR